MEIIIFFSLLLCCIASAVNIRENKILQRKQFITSKGLTQTNIVKGQTATPTQFPHQAGLQLHIGGDYFFNGGALISTEWILTVAHQTSTAQSVTVHLGSIIRLDGIVQYVVNKANIIIHPNFDKIILVNDIALIKIPAVKFTNTIHPIPLPNIGVAVNFGSIVIASGWGLTSENAATLPSNLIFTELKIVSNAECKQYYDDKVIDNGKICAAHYHGGATCHGDSGGPLVMKFPRYLVGITSFGSSGGCEFDTPDGFTRVTYYLNWIKNHTGI